MSRTTGSIDERGLINSFMKMGFTYKQCIGELLSNAIDAGAKIIYIIITREFIYVIDNGTGISDKKIGDMFSLFKGSHNNDY